MLHDDMNTFQDILMRIYKETGQKLGTAWRLTSEKVRLKCKSVYT